MIQHLIEDIIVERNTMLDKTIVGEIRRIATDKGLLTTVQLNEEAIVDALKKRRQQKPDYEGDGYDDSGNIIYDTWICPNCSARYEVDYETHRYCPMCGQAIDWGDDSVDTPTEEDEW